MRVVERRACVKERGQTSESRSASLKGRAVGNTRFVTVMNECDESVEEETW